MREAGFICILIIVLFTAFVLAKPYTNRISPVILIPGTGGTQMFATLNKGKSRYFYCRSTSDSYLIWLSPESLVYPFINCFVDNIRLEYDPNTDSTSTPDGVSITLPGWGETYGVEYLSSLKFTITSYYYPLVNRLVNELGYVRGKSIRAAPFDFRKAPNENADYFIRLKALIEETYAINGFAKVVLFAHSLGGLYAHYFLSTQSQEWKDQYIDSFLSVGAPYGGSVQTVQTATYGYNLGISLVKPLWVRECQRSWPSMHYMLPIKSLWNDTVIASTGRRSYTVEDFDDLFGDFGYVEGKIMRKAVAKSDVNRYKGPGVRTYCIISKGIPTAEKLLWTHSSGFPDTAPIIQSGDGDGTVNIRSLEICSQWSETQSESVSNKIFQKMEHVDLIRSNEFVTYIYEILKNGHNN